MTVDLPLGQNVLTALNFDNVNQPGPATPAVTITLIQRGGDGDVVLPVAPLIPGPSLPTNPSFIPGKPATTGKECYTYTPDAASVPGGKLLVAVVCIPRIIEKNTDYTLGVIVRGGTPPYALNIDWGNDSPDALVSISQSGYTKINFRYASAGPFNITLNAADAQGDAAQVETAVQVNGEVKPIITAIGEALSPSAWFSSPVPLYAVAVIVTLAFWDGDLFDRRFGAGRAPQKRSQRRA